MKIALLGATGFVGSHLLREALARGHSVTGIARSIDNLPEHPSLVRRAADATEPDQLAPVLPGHEVVVRSVRFRSLPAAPLLAAVRKARVPRLVVVGGAASLETAPGRRLIESPDFPPEYRAEAEAGCRFLDALRQEHDLDWTFLSPPANLHDGAQTDKFRVGEDSLLVDPSGQSHISAADYAIALLDEIEHPRHRRRRFTVGY